MAADVDVMPVVSRMAARTRHVRRRSRVTNVWYNSRVKWPSAVRVLDRYLIAELISPFCFGLALFTFFLIIDRIYHLTELVITKGVPFYLVLQLLVFMMLSFLAHTLDRKRVQL